MGYLVHNWGIPINTVLGSGKVRCHNNSEDSLISIIRISIIHTRVSFGGGGGVRGGGRGAFAPHCLSLAPPSPLGSWVSHACLTFLHDKNHGQFKTQVTYTLLTNIIVNRYTHYLNKYSSTFSVPYIYNFFSVTITQFVWGFNHYLH